MTCGMATNRDADMEHEDTLRNLMIMARADGAISSKELILLESRRREWSISREDFDRMLKETESPSASLQIPDTPTQRHDLLADMALMMAADGRFDELEMRLLAIAAVRLGIGEDQLNEILDELAEEDDDLILGD